MADEIELKLELSQNAADAFAASGLVAGEPEVAKLNAIYFDTPDHDLSRVGVVLRIRRSGRKRVQTIKASGGGTAGLFVRPEWERVVRNDIPVIEGEGPAALVGDAAGRLGPVFTVAVERRRWVVAAHGASIELVLDRGAVIAGERRAPVCEIELELLSGEASALFALARDIDAVVPVRLGVQTKAERGFALTGPAPSAVKSAPADFGRDAALAEAVREIVGAGVRQFRRNEALLAAARDPAALRQARVAIRRLRSALSIFKPVTGRGTAALGRELRWLAGSLGEARDLDVLLARAGAGELQERIAAARDAAYARVEAALAAPRARALMLDLAEWAALGDWAQGAVATGSAREFAMRALARLRRKVKKAGHSLAEASDEERHELRKRAKKLRYAAEFFAPLFGGKVERRRHEHFVSALETLQDALGALNDLAAAPATLARAGIAAVEGAEALVRTRGKSKLIAKADKAFDALLDAKRFWK